MKNTPDRMNPEENPFKLTLHFLTLQYQEFNFNLIYDLYFEITAGEKFVIISRFLPETEYNTKKRGLFSALNSDRTLEIDYENELSLGGNLFVALTKFLEENNELLGLPKALEFSAFFSESDWEIVRNYFTERLENSFGKEMLFFFNRFQVNFKPYDAQNGIWSVACPSGENHHLYVDASKKSFHCKHCKKEGHYLDLLDWFETDNQSKGDINLDSNLTYEQLIPPSSEPRHIYQSYWVQTFLTESNFKNLRLKKPKSGMPETFLPKKIAYEVEKDEHIRPESGRLPFFLGTQFGIIPKITDEMLEELEGQLIAVLGKSLLSGCVAGLELSIIHKGERRKICFIRNDKMEDN